MSLRGLLRRCGSCWRRSPPPGVRAGLARQGLENANRRRRHVNRAGASFSIGEVNLGSSEIDIVLAQGQDSVSAASREHQETDGRHQRPRTHRPWPVLRPAPLKRAYPSLFFQARSGLVQPISSSFDPGLPQQDPLSRMPLAARLRENPLVRQVVGFIGATPHHPGVLSSTAHELQAPLATTARLDVALCPLRQPIRPLTRGMEGRLRRARHPAFLARGTPRSGLPAPPSSLVSVDSLIRATRICPHIGYIEDFPSRKLPSIRGQHGPETGRIRHLSQMPIPLVRFGVQGSPVSGTKTLNPWLMVEAMKCWYSEVTSTFHRRGKHGSEQSICTTGGLA